MMDPLSSTNGDGATLSDGLCYSNAEIDQNAWKSFQELLSQTVCGWISQHPRKEEAYSLESEETYMAQAFARFYHLATHQQVEFSQLSTALRCLKMCLNAAILDRVRAASRLRTLPSSSAHDAGESSVASTTDAVNVWKVLIESFSSSRDQRLRYLLFYCGLSPKEIIHSYSQEFTDVREISRLRQVILEQMLPHADHFDAWSDAVGEVNATTRSAHGQHGEGEP